MTNKELMDKAKQDFNEFCKLYNGRPFNSVRKKGNPHNYQDIDYKSITATVMDVGGKCVVTPQMVDIWNEYGIHVKSVYFS